MRILGCLLWSSGVVIYAATWCIFKSKFDNIKKIHPEKKFLYFRKWNFLVPKNLIKLFYTLDKTPLGETGCLNNLYYLLAGQASSFLIHFLCELLDTMPRQRSPLSSHFL